VRTDSIDFVHDPILDPVKHKIESALEYLQTVYQEMEADMKLADIKDFAIKKKITSAMRRILPNGQANEIGFSLNLRSLRHLIELRTSLHAEWEIRLVFNQVFDLINEKYPAMFADVEKEWIDNAWQITFRNKKI
jgi:thymidylate synthase (FAD)